MIVATAGHVDHGKTTLVRALTGVDTDRLPEEKRRGMTIEPGYTHARLGAEGASVGFIDVPGHEGFLRQTIAGLAAADVALLVVACDDGPMPQTRDHLDLLQLLGVQPGAVVLTKADRVDAARLQAVQDEVATLLHGTTFAGQPVFVVSAEQGLGIDALRQGLRQIQSGLPQQQPTGYFRLAVDRAFTRTGIGTVATGTALSGHVQVGDVLRLSPSGQAARVRALQMHGSDVRSVQAGQRCALALAGVEREALGRGTWLLDSALFAPTQRIDATLRLLPTAPRALDGHADLQLHMGAAALSVRVLLLHPKQLSPGEQGLVQLRLPAPVSALHGDHFVLRDTAAHAIVGGGRVLDAEAPTRGKTSEGRIAELLALVTMEDAAEALARLLALRPEGVDAAAFTRQWNLDAAQWATLRTTVPAQEPPTAFGGGRLMAPERWQWLVQQVPALLADWHAHQPASRGMTEAALLGALANAAGMRDKALCRAAMRSAVDAKTVERDGFVLRRPGHEVRLSAEDVHLLQQVRRVMEPMALRPPPLGDLAPLLQLSLTETASALQRMAALGHIVQVARNRYFLPETVLALVQVARDTAAATPEGRFTAASFRDRSGVGRNLTIQLLEFFDRIGFTRFTAGQRAIVD